MSLEDWERELEKDEGFQQAAAELKPILDLADDILVARLARGWSQADLAERAGTRQANISRLESGLANPTLKLLQKLADALDTELVLHLHARETDRAAEAQARERERLAAEGYCHNADEAGEFAAVGAVAETPAPYLLDDETRQDSAMTQMIRKQIYIGKRQQALLARLAASRGVSEAEVIRQAIEREATSMAQRPLPDATALDDLIQAALQRREAGVTGQALQWRREDAYTERLDRHGRQSAQEEAT
jgi:transcriptional regulator with XRE-family HTH domain